MAEYVLTTDRTESLSPLCVAQVRRVVETSDSQPSANRRLQLRAICCRSSRYFRKRHAKNVSTERRPIMTKRKNRSIFDSAIKACTVVQCCVVGSAS